MKRSPYPNIFILPKKYNSVADVRVKDVVDAFPLYEADTFHKYVLRFETVLQISQTRKIAAWMDLDSQLDVQAPHVKGRIRVKALRLPKGIDIKKVPHQVRASNNQDRGHHELPQRQSQHQSKFGIPDVATVINKVEGLFFGPKETH